VQNSATEGLILRKKARGGKKPGDQYFNTLQFDYFEWSSIVTDIREHKAVTAGRRYRGNQTKCGFAHLIDLKLDLLKVMTSTFCHGAKAGGAEYDARLWCGAKDYNETSTELGN